MKMSKCVSRKWRKQLNAQLTEGVMHFKTFRMRKKSFMRQSSGSFVPRFPTRNSIETHISVVYENVMYLCSMLDREIETPKESVERDHS